ncbi:PE-PGRS family protein PE_PGRS26-like [Eucalyptus grandis]|uniref:PE-PGRS family protein PE_PGRS26-like n=1 Tax=Eucalyptus grandis TaxID=71139 RepID=UPI00192E9C55|nr:PE-PGRS family protein PE_PGRS26-like [Eucalyptus grandis]
MLKPTTRESAQALADEGDGGEELLDLVLGIPGILGMKGYGGQVICGGVLEMRAIAGGIGAGKAELGGFGDDGGNFGSGWGEVGGVDDLGAGGLGGDFMDSDGGGVGDCLGVGGSKLGERGGDLGDGEWDPRGA